MTILKRILLCAGSICTAGILSAQEGSVDPTFNPSDAGFGQGHGFGGQVRAVAVQPDGKVIAGGYFYRHDWSSGYHIARLNAGGSYDATFTNPGLVDTVFAVALQPDGRILVGGRFDAWTQGPVSGVTRLTSTGSFDPSFLGTGAHGGVRALAVQPDGRILIGGDFYNYDGSAANRIVRLNTDGTLDWTFSAGAGPNGRINAIALQADGKIIIAGEFTSVNGTARGRIARLNTNGTLDATFATGAGASPGAIECIRPAAGGTWLIGGSFTGFDGTSRNRLARISSTGALDTSFDPGSGANGPVHDMAVRPDGRVVLAGAFDQVNGSSRPRLAQLLSTGALDAIGPPALGPNGATFCLSLLSSGQLLVGGDQNAYSNRYTGHLTRLQTDLSQDLTFGTAQTGVLGDGFPTVFCTAEQPDGKLLLAGDFDGYNGYAHHGIVRCSPDGTVDQTFDPNTPVPMLPIRDMVLQPDGKILIAGYFIDYNGTSRNKIARLNADGSLDGTFNPGTGADGGIEDLALLPNGKILIAGAFTSFNGSAAPYLARLNADGSLDATFVPGTGPNSSVNALTVQADGRILIAGYFTSVNAAPRGRVARLHVDGALDTGFAPVTGANNFIKAVVLVSGEKLLITGHFSSYNGVTRTRLARLLSDGTLDTSFDPAGGLDGAGDHLVVQPDGSVIVIGGFYNYNGIPRRNILRLSPFGSLDPYVYATASCQVECATILRDGDILVGGGFVHFPAPGNNTVGRNHIARINGTARTGIKVMLEGPYSGTTMTDALRTLPSFPLTEPFTAMGYTETGYVSGATIGSSVLATTGNNAIVDWVIVEMRPVATPGTVAASRAVLLQRDGDVVDLDGVSTVGFAGLAPGSYCVAVKPRNHLPVMLSATTPVSYGAAIATVDFTLPTTQVYDNDARKNVSGVMVLAAGDVTFNEAVGYTGAGNDRDPILTRIGSTTPNATASGYWREDVNMDGVVKYTGSANDRDIILTNVGSTTPNNTRVATLP